jgi:hypothetical protein
MKSQHISCDGCVFNKGGRCHDRTVYGLRGGDLLTGNQPRHCYEVNTLTLLTTGLAYKASAKVQEQVTSDLWRRIREDLELLKQEHVTLHTDTSEIVEWLQVETKDWQGIGDQIRRQQSDSDDE